jgi:hypothetical protein
MAEQQHYTVEMWADFVRGVLQRTEQAGMQAHLDSGCAGCAASVKWLGALARTWNQDFRLPVPADLTARAIELFQARRPKRDWVLGLRELAAELVAERRLDWLPLGVRASESTGHRLLFRAGDYEVDLNFDPGGSEDPAGIVGQIANHRDRSESLDGVLVQLLAAGRTVGETETNRYGEFVIERPVRRGVVLRIAMEKPGFRIELPIRADVQS